jgi:hypothetical protein
LNLIQGQGTLQAASDGPTNDPLLHLDIPENGDFVKVLFLPECCANDQDAKEESKRNEPPRVNRHLWVSLSLRIRKISVFHIKSLPVCK